MTDALKRAAVPVLTCLLGVAMMFGLSLFGGRQIGWGDHWLNQYFLEHTFSVLSRSDYVGHLWSPPFFYPWHDVLAFSDNLLGTAPIYWALRTAVDTDAAFLLWIVANCVLSFAAAWWALRRFGASAWLAALGAFWFAFGLPHLAQFTAGHEQLLAAAFTPLAFACAWDFLQQPRARMLAAVAGLTLLQWLASLYLGAFLSIGLMVFAVATLATRADCRRAVRNWGWPGVAVAAGTVAVFGGLLALLLAPYANQPGAVNAAPLQEIVGLEPTLSSWLAAMPQSLLWGGLHVNAQAAEQYLFPGLVLTLLVLALPWLGRNDQSPTMPCLWSAVALGVLTLRWPGGFSAWTALLHVVPALSAFRAVSRMALVIQFLLAAATLPALSITLSRLADSRRELVTGLVLLAAILDGAVIMPIPGASERDRAVAIQSVLGDEPAYAELDSRLPWHEQQLAAMWAGLQGNVPVINGYSGHAPAGYKPPWESMDLLDLSQWVGPSVHTIRVIYPNRADVDTAPRLWASAVHLDSSAQLVAYTIPLPIQRQFSGTLKVNPDLPSLSAGQEIPVRIEATNSGRAVWWRKAPWRVQLHVAWLGGKVPAEVVAPLTDDVPPSGQTTLMLSLPTPQTPGEYVLRLEMLQDQVPPDRAIAQGVQLLPVSIH
ncbi:MAG: hypothetical protein ACYCW6_17455 [Candidatus Xenobia bacterium]